MTRPIGVALLAFALTVCRKTVSVDDCGAFIRRSSECAAGRGGKLPNEADVKRSIDLWCQESAGFRSGILAKEISCLAAPTCQQFDDCRRPLEGSNPFGVR